MPSTDQLPPGQQLAAAGKWPLVGEKSARDLPSVWTVEVTGLVARPQTWTLDELRAMPQVDRAIDVHCVTRWTKFGMRFRGVPLSALLGACQPVSNASFVSFVSHSPRDHSTSLPLDVCQKLDVLIAFEAEGQHLSIEHGGPVRTITPGRYFYKSLKWLKRIELLAEDRLGYWEAEAGYHNEADPWREQRYLASTLGKREAAELIAARDFRGRDLRGIQADHLDLRGLQATDALLRDARFRRADLRGACFDGANLSNAHCEGADLQEASLRRADLEGANFEGADLRRANLQGASLFGATFLAADGTAAIVDPSTRIDAETLEQLTPAQADFIRAKLQA